MFASTLPDDDTALVCTSDFREEVHTVSHQSGIIIDNGASRHFSPDRSKFLNYEEFVNQEPIRAPDRRPFHALVKGDIQIHLPNGKQGQTLITLKEAYYSPIMAFTLISVSSVDRAGLLLVIGGGICEIKTSKSRVIGRIPQICGRYRVYDAKPPFSHSTHSANIATKEMSINELHKRMGHVNNDDLRRMVEKGMVTGIKLDMSSKPGFCEICVKAKAARKPFPKESITEYRTYGEKVVADVWGPAPVKSIGGKEYYLLFKDLFSHEERIYFLKQKSEVFDHYKKYKAWVKVQRGGQIIVLGCDRGGEFTGRIFSDYLENVGTARHLTVHDSPASNGIVERANRTHLDGARAMMEAAKLPNYLWAEAVNHHVWIRNRVPTRALKVPKTPLEMATNCKPDLSGAYPWGCKVWVKRLDVGKLEPRAEECRFVGIDSESKGFRVYWPGKNRVVIERDVYFNENDALEPEEVQVEGGNDLPNPKPSNNPQTLQPTVQSKPIQAETDPETQITESSEESATPRNTTRRNSLKGLPHFNDEQFGRGKRQRVPTSRAKAVVADVEEPFDANKALDAEETLHQNGKSLDQGGVVEEDALFGEDIEIALAISEDEPSIREALNGDEREAWCDTIEAELTQMEKVNAWVPVIPPPNANIIPSLFVFRRKRNDTGSIIRYKARLVVKGFKQQFGVDYFDTFAPTVRAPTLRILLSFAAQMGAAIHQCDIKNAYLNSRLQDNITLYSELPPKYEFFRQLPPDLR